MTMTTTDDRWAVLRPEPVDVLAATAHPDTRRIDLDDRVVLRTPDRPDHAGGNAVLRRGGAVLDEQLTTALADARTRLVDPRTTPRVVVPRTPRTEPVTGDEPAADDRPPVVPGARTRLLDALLLADPAGSVPQWSRREGVAVAPPRDARDWHGVTVLRRHARPMTEADDGGESRTSRARGGDDDLLRWWVDGRRRLVAEGRARVVVATRFGTPVAAVTLVWAPAVAVGDDGAGLAVLCDLVVHPAHRGLGIGRTTAADVVERHLRDFPRAVVAAVVPTSAAGGLRATGWREHARLVELADTSRSSRPGPTPR